MDISIVRDLRAAFGSARNQGMPPTCLAFAASDVPAAVRGSSVPLSSEFAFYHAQRRSKRPPHQGAGLSTMLEVLKEDGQPVESEWPYLASLPSDLASWRPPAGITQVYRRQSDACTATVDDIVRLLDDGRPVLTTMMLSDSFYLPANDGVVDVVPGEGPDPTRRHAVVAVGQGIRNGKRLILVRNSWGAGWGIGGHGWLTESFLQPRLMRIAVLAQEA
ncbi:MAG: C1 family peptidase [Bryobacteraceae bacterium]